MTSSAQPFQQQNAENNADTSDSQGENVVTTMTSPATAATAKQPSLSDPNRTSRPTTQPPTKQSYRERVWQHLQQHRLAQFPLPARGRIPNIRGGDQAVQQHLRSLSVWRNARSVCVNADKAQESVRAAVLRDGKELYVAVPRVEGGFLRRLVKVAKGDEKERSEGEEGKVAAAGKELQQQQSLKHAVNRRGLEQNGTVVPYVIASPTSTPTSDDDTVESAPLAPPQLDLVVVGAVAVSRANGRHIGKGRGGYADLEYGILGALGTLTEDTQVVTVVHDCQVFDDLPDELFNEHDVSVDYIVTPTGIIDIAMNSDERPARPKGVFWPLVSNRRLALMPVLQYLREQQERSDIDVTLKDEDTDIESREPRLRRRFLRRRRNVPPPQRNNTNTNASNNTAQDNKDAAPPGDGKENVKPQRRRIPPRRFFRRPRTPKDANNVTDSSTERGRDGATSSNSQPTNQRQGRTNSQGNNRFRPFRRLPPHIIDFSLKVSNIERSVRVRDLKQALVERGIKPQVITWVGYRGFCLLHYAKPRPLRQHRDNPNSEQNTPLHAATPTTDGEDEEKGLKDNQNMDSRNRQQVENGRRSADDGAVGPEKGPVNGHVAVKQFVLDDVIEILQNMRIGPDSETNLDVRVMKPLPDKAPHRQQEQQHAASAGSAAAVVVTPPMPTRIETTGVSAV